MQSKISDKLKRGSVRMNSSPDLLKSPARKILGDEMNETILKLSMKVTQRFYPFQETNSQIIFPSILKGKKSHESKANEGRDTQTATRVSVGDNFPRA